MKQNRTPSRLLVFENRMEGHHLHWLRFITEDFLSAGKELTLAVDIASCRKNYSSSRLMDIMDSVTIMPVFDSKRTARYKNIMHDVAYCMAKSDAEEVFINNLDEMASRCFRNAAFGMYPPGNLKGKISGVYFRPRFLNGNSWHPGNFLKNAGFKRLLRGGWFNKIFFLDEHLVSIAKRKYAHRKFYFLPDPWDAVFPYTSEEAKKKLGIPYDRFVFLCYGVKDRRKGLHLAVKAAKELPRDSRIYLLCAGNISPEGKTGKDLKILQNNGKAKIIDRYISDFEQSLCFCACDAVLLPYIRHFGSSGVLSLAAAAAKPVIASDENLLARRIRQHNLGMLFRPCDTRDLLKKMNEASELTESAIKSIKLSASSYAGQCSRDAFRAALLSPYTSLHAARDK
jgi:glycosyltransferase involved in cell wall biosynthesis